MPKVCIGVPVYNGERFLAPCLNTLLDQTFQDFKIIISDNASTDGTAEICQRYADRSTKIRYHRRDRNYGAANNFDHVFHISDGPYFKWAAHDDVLLPTYLEKCVAALEEDPTAVGAHSLTDLIDEEGKPLHFDEECGAFVDRNGRSLGIRPDNTSLNEEESPVVRFHGILKYYKLNTAVFGVYRRDVMERSGLILPFLGQDKVLIAEFALHGRLRVIHEPLFLRRTHSFQASSLTKEDQAKWLAPNKRHKPLETQIAALQAYLAAIDRAPLTTLQKLQCRALVLRQCLRREKWSLRYLGFRP